MEASMSGIDLAALAVVEALLNGVWQGAALAAAVALLLRLGPRTSAAARHAVWGGALVLVAAMPLARLRPPEMAGSAAAPGPAAVPGTLGWSLAAPPEPWALTILILLGAGALARVVGIVRGARELRRLKRAAFPLPADRLQRIRVLVGARAPRAAEVRVSDGVSGPISAGFRHPMVLLPAGFPEQLGEEELAQVVLHELAHLRRRDDWIHLAQRVLEGVLFFHPVVRWIGRRLELEREMACDQEVVAALQDPRAYARCLTRLAGLAVAARRTSLAPGAVPRTSQLARRVSALLAPDRPAGRTASAAGLALAGAAMLAGTAMLHRSPLKVGFTEAGAAAVPRLAAAHAARVAEAEPAPAAVRAPNASGTVRLPVRRGGRTAAPAPDALALAHLEPSIATRCGSPSCLSVPPVVQRASIPERAPLPRVAERPREIAPRASVGRAAVQVTLAVRPGGTAPRLGLRGDVAGWDGGLLGEMGRVARIRFGGGGGGWKPRPPMLPRR